MVQHEITNMNINKSLGPDEIHPRMLKELIQYVSQPIVILLNTSVDESAIPNDWKKAFVSPIYKKGARNIAEN